MLTWTADVNRVGLSLSAALFRTGNRTFRERTFRLLVVGVEMPSEKTTQGQGGHGQQDEVDHSVEMKRREDHGSHGCRQSQAGGQRQEETGGQEDRRDKGLL